jgi:hypothetical protein
MKSANLFSYPGGGFIRFLFQGHELAVLPKQFLAHSSSYLKSDTMNLETAQIVPYRPERLRSEVGTRDVKRRRRVGELGALGAIAQRRGPSLGRKPSATDA